MDEAFRCYRIALYPALPHSTTARHRRGRGTNAFHKFHNARRTSAAFIKTMVYSASAFADL